MVGFAGKYLVLIIMLGFFSIFYIALNTAYTQIYDWQAGQIDRASSQTTATLMNIMWVWLPVLVLFSYMIYSISQASKEKEIFP